MGLGGGSLKPVFIEEIRSSGKRERNEKDKKIDAVARVKRMKYEMWYVGYILHLWFESKGTMFAPELT